MKKAELVFIPLPGVTHFVPTAEFATCLLDRDERLSVTFIALCPLPEIEARIQLHAASYPRIRCITIGGELGPPSSSKSVEKLVSKSLEKLTSHYIESSKSQVEDTIMTQILSDDSVQLAGIVIDLFCTSMIDVAHKLKIPSYIFFASGAAFLGFVQYLPVHRNRVGGNHFDPTDVQSIVPTYANPVPMNALPSFAFDKDGYSAMLDHGTRFKEAKGFIVNTFAELEPHAMGSLMETPPPIHAVGPLLDFTIKENSKSDEIVTWLDDQPPSSVVFLCFGSRGCFDTSQLEQIAIALEKSHQRFLWSIRRPPPKDSFQRPTEYQSIQEVPLPAGFLERTEKRGMVCGWAPQVQVLAHPAIGGFVSHCGWNSTLESLWHGVPIATWPLYAEQQINAFELVEELGLAVDLKMDYRACSGDDQVLVVMADVIERAIKSLMDVNSPVRRRAKMMGEKSRMAVADGGSSSASLGRLIEDFLENIQVI